MNTKPCDLTITEASQAITSGDLSVQELTESCLQRINAIESEIHAWAYIDASGAIEVAKQLDLELKQGKSRGILHGIPVGIKDIFHVAGMPTKAGSRFLHLNPEKDATVVKRLRDAGAVILGKTHTTEFAYFHPAITCNPWNPEHTPGGSSSGSAAAVAAGMCIAALGTQTLGSILRPAAFTGLVGLKPQYGRVSTAGVIPLSWSLDHIGVIARTVDDAGSIFQAMAGHDSDDGLSLEAPVPDLYDSHLADYKPVISFVKDFFFENSDKEMQESTLKSVDGLRKTGFQIRELKSEIELQDVVSVGNTVMAVEAAAYHKDMFEEHTASYGAETKALIERGLACSATEYADAVHELLKYRHKVARLFENVDIIVAAGATGPAPQGLGSTGSPVIHAPWTILGIPSISLPTGLSENGLPLAVQLAASPCAEDKLLIVARQCETIFGFTAKPPLIKY